MVKDEMKKKYAEAFNRQDNYEKITQLQKYQRPRQVLILTALALIGVLIMPYFGQKKDVQLAYDEAFQEIGPEIVLNINLVPEEMKMMDTALALRANVQLKSQVLQEYSSIPFEDFCPEGWRMSDVVCMTMIEKDTDEVLMNYDCVEMTAESKSIRLMTSSDQYPFRCYVLSPDEATSKIDGIEMKISYRADLGLYLCLFQIENFYFDVEASGLNEHELIDFLVNLIKEVRENS